MSNQVGTKGCQTSLYALGECAIVYLYIRACIKNDNTVSKRKMFGNKTYKWERKKYPLFCHTSVKGCWHILVVVKMA